MYTRCVSSTLFSIRDFTQWRLALLAVSLLFSAVLTPRLALAQAIHQNRIEIRSNMTETEIYSELSRYFTAEIESGTHRYQMDAASVQMTDNGPVGWLTAGSVSVVLVFLTPTDFSSSSRPIAADCSVTVEPAMDKNGSSGLQWVIVCGKKISAAFHALPKPAG